MADKSVPDVNIGRSAIGYMVNAGFSNDNQLAIGKLQNSLVESIKCKLWLAPLNSLHVTLCDWVAPLVDYGKDKDELFETINSEYSKVLGKIIEKTPPIKIVFKEIRVGESAIFIVGSDDGQFASIRRQFLDKLNLIPGTKLPPKIIHSTIARFEEISDLNAVREDIEILKIDITQSLSGFTLVRETKIPMLQSEVIRTFQLKGI